MNRRHFLLTSTAASLGSFLAQGAETPAKIRVAVIGHTGQGDYGHGLDTMWLKLPETEIVGVADADPAGLAKAVAKLKLERGWPDYRQMLAETKPEVVAIAPRWIGEHRDMALAAIEAGAKGIYMEKPFCRTLGEADEITAACEKHGTRLAIAHRNRYHPALPVALQLIAGGKIGRVLEIRCRGKEDARGGPLDLWVLGSHLLSLAVAFSGNPTACSATVFQNGKPATRADVKEGAEGTGPLGGNELHARFETQSGIPIFFDSIANAGAKGAGFGLQVIGTTGLLDLRGDAQPLIYLRPGSPFTPDDKPHPWTPVTSGGLGVPEPIAGLTELMSAHLLPGRDLLAAIRENRAPLCSAADGRILIEMILATFESHRQGSARIPFPLQIADNPIARWA